jgi:beta-galactosidase
MPTARVALIHDYDSCWAIEAYPHAEEFDYWAHLRTYYRALRRRGVQVDVVPPDSDLDGYAAVAAPTLYVLPPALADRLTAYVEGGGQLLVTIRSGVADAANQWFGVLFPGPLSDTTGVEVSQHESLPPALETRVTYRGETYDYRTWAEWLLPDGASVLGEHASGPATGEPAVTHNGVGDGGATYVGVWPENDLANAIVDDLLDRADVATTPPLPERVHVTQRGEYTWVTNFRASSVSVDAPGDAEWVHGGGRIGGHDLAVVRADRRDLQVTVRN